MHITKCPNGHDAEVSYSPYGDTDIACPTCGKFWRIPSGGQSWNTIPVIPPGNPVDTIDLPTFPFERLDDEKPAED